MVVLTSKYIEENNPHLTTYKCTNKKPTTNVKPSNKKNKNKAHFFSINLNVVKKVQKVYREKKKTKKFITIFSNTIQRTKEENYKQDFFFSGIFLSLLIFLSVAGNILVCIAIYTERSLRRIGNLFLASLAIADLFVASLVMTFAGVNDILGENVFF